MTEMQILQRHTENCFGRVEPGLAIPDPSQHIGSSGQASTAAIPSRGVARVLIVDDEASIRLACRCALELEGLRCDEATDGRQALQRVHAGPPDLVVLDVDMPGMKGTDVCRELRASFPSMSLKIIMISGRATPDELARLLSAGADDVINKPFSVVQLQARVKAALQRKEDQTRSDQLYRNLLSLNHTLECDLTSRESDLAGARQALVLALTTLAEYRDNETGGHLRRLARFSVCLAEAAAASPFFRGRFDEQFIKALGVCSPLHDIGKVGLPDHILRKPGELTSDERVIMQTHTVIGYETLKAVAQQHSFARGFLELAMEIARHHHERYDGRGYPDRLTGEAIPLAARLVAICDVYDALRSPRVYKSALSHEAVMAVLTQQSAGQFDPGLLELLPRCAAQFERIYLESLDPQASRSV